MSVCVCVLIKASQVRSIKKFVKSYAQGSLCFLGGQKTSLDVLATRSFFSLPEEEVLEAAGQRSALYQCHSTANLKHHNRCCHSDAAMSRGGIETG